MQRRITLASVRESAFIRHVSMNAPQALGILESDIEGLGAILSKEDSAGDWQRLKAAAEMAARLLGMALVAGDVATVTLFQGILSWIHDCFDRM